MSGHERLKLRAHDAEDLEALAALLQDALVARADMAYLKAEKRFVLVANRFRWDRAGAPAAAPVGRATEHDAGFQDEGPPPFERVNCGICFDRVRRVRTRGFDPRRGDEILSLLTLLVVPGTITLVFAGGGEVRLEASAIRCHMEDLGEPWPTRWRPAHAPDAPPGRGD